MHLRHAAAGLAFVLVVTLGALPLKVSAADSSPEKMRFDDVKEIAPGVFFRYSAISPTNPNVFGGSNNIWVVFEDYVVVIDANFPKEAGDVLTAVRKTTSKPVRYVLDTHHHGDHAWGNAVWVKAGATIVAQTHCGRLLRETGPTDFAAAGKGPTGRKDVAASTLSMPTLLFDEKLVLDDGKQRVEFLHFGHSHTIGDAVAYLPKYKILCTGDACVNGPYNFMGHSDSASWIRCLEKMQQLDVQTILPGHGLPMGKELLAKQKRYFIDLRREVKKGIDEGKDVEDIIQSVNLPWYKEWTTVKPAVDNIKHVWNEYMGLVSPWDFALDYGIYAGPSTTKYSPGWTKPKKIVVPSGLPPARLVQLKRAAPEVEFLPARDPEEAARLAVDADAVLGFATPQIVKSGKKLRWIQTPPDGATAQVLSAAHERKLTLTDSRRLNGPQVADQTFALILALTRNLSGKAKTPPTELRSKTILLVGLGGSGEQIARRAQAFGARVRALDDQAAERPDYVFSLEKLSTLLERLPEADFVVLALPLTAKNQGIIGAKALKLMKKSALLVNAAHTSLVDLAALAEAVQTREIAGAGLDTTDTGSLPADHVLRKLPTVVLTAHHGVPSPEAQERHWRLYRENVRRFAAGEPLLCVVVTTATSPGTEKASGRR
jgi:phosphoglycerate dehydrogenase-like enzyme/glyoxylase-like metal-dependent hydrolase (beta-lactamase superfamily II)